MHLAGWLVAGLGVAGLLPADVFCKLRRSSCGAAVLGEELYVVGGSITAENQSHEGVECFCPRAGRWRGCAPIGHGRSGLTVLPV